MSPETLGALFTGLAGLIATISAFSANRSKQSANKVKLLSGRVRTLEKQLLELTRHTFALELELARVGAKIPERPDILNEPLPGDLLEGGP